MSALTSKRVAIYARFSSDRQSETSIEDQVGRCRRWIEGRGAAFDVSLVFTDFAVSGASLNRPGWSALEARIVARDVDVVVVESLDRISRKVADTAHLLERLRFAGVGLVGIGDGIDTTTATGSTSLVQSTVKGLVGELYLADLADKTHRGLEGRARAGLAAGGVAYGFRTVAADKGRAIEIDPDQAAVVRRIFNLYGAGRSRNEIATLLNREGVAPPRSSRRDRATPATWQQTTVRSLLLNETYAGRWVWNRRQWVKEPGTNRRVPRDRPRHEWIVTERPDLAIVDAETWARANVRTEETAAALGTMSPSERLGDKRRSYLLSGLLRCGPCGGLMAVHGGTDSGHRYYRCSNASDRGTCSNRASFREADAREAFLTALRSVLFDEEVIGEVLEIITEEIARDDGGAVEVGIRRDRVAKIEAQIERLVDVLVAGGSPAIADRVRKLEADLASERGVLAAVLRSRKPMPDVAAVLADLHRLDALMSAENVRTAREALRTAIPGGSIRATPKGKAYVLEAELLPPAIVGQALGSTDCGGRI